MDTEQRQNNIQPNQIPTENRGFKPKRTISEEFRIFINAVFSWIVIPLLVVIIIHNFFFQAYHVVGASMQPNLHETDYLIISKLGQTGNEVRRIFGADTSYIPARGQVVVFRFPKDPNEIFVKRVIGVPGDRVVIKDGIITVYNATNPDGFNPDAKYESTDTITLIDTDVTVRDGHVFVVGDNRGSGESYDSREWGELPSNFIIGNAIFRLLPIDQFKLL